LLIAIQAVGVIGVLIGALSTDWLRFVGLRQALAYLRGDDLPLPPEPLQITGLYRLVRHPLYLFSMVGLWAIPFLTANVLAFNIGATLYFAIGLIFEEKRLEAIYSDAYRAYQAQVPALLPLPRPRGARLHLLSSRSDTDHGKT
jgi:protein-S-isoprenylcysteine O-methyltransferase Ste14